MAFVDFLFRWGHVLFGITWIGILYYFNFIQGSYFAEAEAAAKADATRKLVPRALWWFRWGAMFTFLTGVYLLYVIGSGANQYILLGALMGIFMFLNVWLIIWPAQKIVTGITQGDAAAAAPKAMLASRTNTLFSGPMLYGMLASQHAQYAGTSQAGSLYQAPSLSDLGFILPLLLILLIEINAIIGKVGPMKSVPGVIHSSLALTAIIFALVHFI